MLNNPRRTVTPLSYTAVSDKSLPKTLCFRWFFCWVEFDKVIYNTYYCYMNNVLVNPKTIIFKVSETEKEMYYKMAVLRGMTLSQYLRTVLKESTQNNTKPNILLKMAGFMSEEEATDHNNNIYNSRKNKK